MLLNQSDYPKALECIDTAQEVLRSDLRGIVCFRLVIDVVSECALSRRKFASEGRMCSEPRTYSVLLVHFTNSTTSLLSYISVALAKHLRKYNRVLVIGT